MCVCEPVRVCVEERVRDTEGVDGAERVCVAVSKGVERGLIVTLALAPTLKDCDGLDAPERVVDIDAPPILVALWLGVSMTLDVHDCVLEPVTLAENTCEPEPVDEADGVDDGLAGSV